MCLPIHYSSLPQSLEKMVAGKKQTTHGCSGTSFPMAAIIAFPVQIAQFVGEPDKGNSIHLKMGKPIFS